MPSAFKQFIEEIAGEKAPGPAATFSSFHIYHAMELMAEKPIGRSKLASKINVGEGAVRTIIRRLKDAGLISTSRSGCKLTQKGLNVWREFQAVFKKSEIGDNELASARFNIAFLVKDRGNKVKSGLEQRDAAVMAGAKGATTIISKDGHLVMASVSNDVRKDFPEAASQILKLLAPEDNDVIIIAGADAPIEAEHGAFAAAWTLLDNH